MIFTPFDLSAAITPRLSLPFPLVLLIESESRPLVGRRGEREKEGEKKRRKEEEEEAKIGEKGRKTRKTARGWRGEGGVTRGQDDGLVYESPRNNGSPFYSWSTPLFEGSTWMWKGYHSTPEFPTQGEEEGIFRRAICSTRV